MLCCPLSGKGDVTDGSFGLGSGGELNLGDLKSRNDRFF